MLGRKLRLEQVLPELRDKRVLMRVDFNVPVKNGAVTDTTRLRATVPSIRMILDNGAKSLVLMSHLGRPDGRVVPASTLRLVVSKLEELISHPVVFLEDCVGEAVVNACANPEPGTVILLENLRFHPEEEGSGVDEEGKKFKPTKEAIAAFRTQLTALGDVYINDAFGTAHRAHSSMTGVDLPLRAAGLLMGKELEYFSKALENPNRPLLIIMGGAKVKDKIQLIMNLLNVANEMIIGGGMAFTFKKVLENMEIGGSLFDADGAAIIPQIMEKAREKGVQIHLPVDFRCGDKFAEGCNVQVCAGAIPEGWIGMDVGPQTDELFREVINRAKTVVWNGPAGVFENPAFRSGSQNMLDAVVHNTADHGQVSIVGGGDTAAFVQSAGAASSVSHISTGGGASLELMEGKELPGAAYLTDRSS